MDASILSELPPDWDFALDLVMIVGAGGEGWMQELLDAGQARLLMSPGEDTASLPAGVSVVREPVEVLGFVLGLRGTLPRRLVVKRTPAGGLSDADHRAFAEALVNALQAKKLHWNTLGLRGKTWLLQGLANLPRIARTPTIAPLFDAFGGRPAVIVSPGPSLAKNVALLKELEGRALILAGTHVLALLQQAGVTPDVVVISDPGDLDRHFEGFDASKPQALVVGATCRPGNFERGFRRTFVFASDQIDDWVFDGLPDERPALATGGSVACTAFSLAHRLGCDPVLLMGQDLAFPDGRYYAEGSLDGNARIATGPDGSFFLRKPEGAEGPGPRLTDGSIRYSRDQKLVQVPAHGGAGVVPTSASLHAFLLWFEGVASALRDELRVWNVTEGGARIHGTRELTLRQAIDELAPEPFDSAAVFEGAARPVEPEARAAAVRRHAESMLDALKPCANAARRCQKLVKNAHRDAGAARALEREERKLVQALAPVRLFALVAQDEIVAAQDAARRATTLEESFAASRRLYDLVNASVELLRAPIKQAARELSGRAS